MELVTLVIGGGWCHEEVTITVVPVPPLQATLRLLLPPQHFPEHLDHFVDNMEDFSNDLFSSFFDDPVLDEKSPLLDMELESPAPGIQAEHSYSLSGDSAPQSPLVPVKMEDTTQGKMCEGPGGRKLLGSRGGGGGGRGASAASQVSSPQTPFSKVQLLAFWVPPISNPFGYFSKGVP